MTAAKEWFRNNASGQMGYKVGADRIKDDRPEGAERRFKPEEWTAIAEHRPLAPAHLAEICFNADANLSFYLGIRDGARKQWLDLTAEQKHRWMTEGPPTENKWRVRLYKAIQANMKGLVE